MEGALAESGVMYEAVCKGILLSLRWLDPRRRPAALRRKRHRLLPEKAILEAVEGCGSCRLMLASALALDLHREPAAGLGADALRGHGPSRCR